MMDATKEARNFGRLGILGLLATIVVGCVAELVFDQGAKSNEEFSRDSYECERDTRMSAASFQQPRQTLLNQPDRLAQTADVLASISNLLAPLAEKEAAQKFFARCMTTQGYQIRGSSPSYASTNSLTPDAGSPLRFTATNRPAAIENQQQRNASSPTVVTSLPPNMVPPPAKKTTTKTYASLVQYDGPKVKSGITLEAEFIDDGSSSGEAKVFYPANSYVLNGRWTTLPPGKVEAPKLIEKKALNALRLMADKPLTTMFFSDNNTVLECFHGETASTSQRKGECQDNYGNKYHLVFHP
jgi:hypothetical protein